eukprot:CAMPEP_0178446588 /NCGR_PEP_ID=MMETSP0689_2-20121128/40895_1 /TAXON_ID=160604 /ORGANISM="Amphidinium massartii, Strain CS-259" /LENGTH=176 /DNA_ID=CAMNT_0020071445 /DNA_START=35 /DNA_END=566 /DNA_ORIENTATION=-
MKKSGPFWSILVQPTVLVQQFEVADALAPSALHAGTAVATAGGSELLQTKTHASLFRQRAEHVLELLTWPAHARVSFVLEAEGRQNRTHAGPALSATAIQSLKKDAGAAASWLHRPIVAMPHICLGNSWPFLTFFLVFLATACVGWLALCGPKIPEWTMLAAEPMSTAELLEREKV